jgi:formyl-CoA transferase
MWAMSPDIVGAPLMGDLAISTERAQAPNPLANGYATKDQRWIYFVCLQPDPYWSEFCQCIGHPEIATDQRFCDATARFQNRESLISLLDAVFAEMDLEEVNRRFAGFSGVWAPVLRPAEIHSHPQVIANDFLPEVAALDGTSTYRIVAAPMHFSGHATRPSSAAPELGQHTEEVLLEAGLDWDQIEHLRATGGLG